MNQKTTDPFFRLGEEASDIEQDAFYEHLSRSDHLCDTIFSPDTLEIESKGKVTRIKNKVFERVSFAKTDIIGIIFRDCKFKDCLFMGTNFLNCEFHKCKFIRSNMHKCSFRDTYISPSSFKKALNKKKHQNIGVHLYQALMNNFKDSDQPDLEAEARFLFLRWKRYQRIYEARVLWSKSKIESIKEITVAFFSFLWEKLFGSGIKMRYFVLTFVTFVSLVTCGNYLFRDCLGIRNGEVPVTTFTDSFYFSIVTLTTLGFGDITPTKDLGKIIVALEGMSGFILFAILASMLFRRIAR